MGQQVRSASKSYLCKEKKKVREREKRKRNQSSDSPDYLCLPRCYVSAPAEHSPETHSFPLRKRGSGVEIPKLNDRIMSELLYEVRAEGEKDPLLVISALSCAPLFMAKPVT